MHLLLKISQFASTNGMDSKNIAICVGPNLIWPNTGHETTNVGEMCLLIIFFIDYCQQIFGTELPALYQQAEVQLRIDMDRMENTNSPICTKLDGPNVVENKECHRQLQEESLNMDCNLIATSVTDVSVTGWMDISIPILTPSSASPAAISTGLYNTLDNQVIICVQSSPTSNDSYTTSAGSETGEEGFHNSQKNKECQICPRLTPSSASSLAASTGMYNTLENQIAIHVQNSPTSNDLYAPSTGSESVLQEFHNSQKDEECQVCPCLTLSSASSLAVSTGMYNTLENQVAIHFQNSPISNDLYAPSAGSETGEEGFHNSQKKKECQICPHLQSNTDVQPDTVTTSQVKQLTEYFSKFEKNPISLDIGNTKARLGLIPQLSQKQKEDLSSTSELKEAIQAPIRDNKRNTESRCSKKLPSWKDDSKITASSVAERREVWERQSRGGNIPTEKNKSGSLNTGKEAGSSGDDSIY